MKLKTIIKNLVLITGVITLSGVLSCNLSTKEKVKNPSGFEIKRGTNLSHWLSQDFGWSPKYTYINENDIRFIDSLGFDHVRIPIDEMEMWDEQGNPIPEAFHQLNSCLDWCSKRGLKAIVDLHIVRSHYFNAGNEGGSNTLWTDSLAQSQFINIWITLSGILKDRPNKMVAYEILNEAVAPKHDDWNKLMNRAIEAIRKLEPNRVLIIGPNMWQIAPNLQFLKLPEGDKNIILSFHTYSPLAFTHYKASWNQMKNYTGKVHYPGQIITGEDYDKHIDKTNQSLVNLTAEAREVWNKEKLFEVFKSGVEFAKSKNLQLYCGEFGCMPTVDRKDRLAWYTDMIDILEENGVAWSNWEYKGDFGLYFFDAEKKVSLQPDYELINVLLSRKNKK
jgi:endoglucanase